MRPANGRCQVLARPTTLHIETIKALGQLVGIAFVMQSNTYRPTTNSAS